MALNPPISPNFEPQKVKDEIFILKRKNIEWEVKVPGMGKYKGKGHVVLTTARMVLISKKPKDGTFSFDLPLANIFSEKFNQPIFGANYYSGECVPLFGLLPNDARYKIWFMSGGCGAFLKCI